MEDGFYGRKETDDDVKSRCRAVLLVPVRAVVVVRVGGEGCEQGVKVDDGADDAGSKLAFASLSRSSPTTSSSGHACYRLACGQDGGMLAGEVNVGHEERE